MTRFAKILLLASVVACSLVAPATGASADVLPAPATDHASCMGSGSAFYGTFAARQRAFVAQYVIDQAAASDTTPGSVYRVFAQEKEGGAIPAPCGTRIE